MADAVARRPVLSTPPSPRRVRGGGLLALCLALVWTPGCADRPAAEPAAGGEEAVAAGEDDAPPAEAERPRPEDTEVWEPEPGVVTPGDAEGPPSDATVLFEGTDLSGWEHEDGSDARWTVEDGAVTVAPGTGNIRTRRSFGDVQLHLEWRTPEEVSEEGQERGNSGVFFMERYELQVLDSYENRTYANGQAGSLYKQHIPLVNASRPPGVWQSYDVIFTAPRFAEDGSLVSPASMTVLHNGVLIHDRAELRGPTVFIGESEYEPHAGRAPIMLQDHGNLVSYRNIWLREIAPLPR